MEDLTRVLREHHFLHHLTDDQIKFVVGCARNLRFAPGAFLLREGTAADQLFLIRSGQVALEIHVPGRGVQQLETLGAGDLLGLSWLRSPRRVQLDARAVDTVIAIALDATCLRRKMEEDHDLGYAMAMRVLEAVTERLERARLLRLDLYRAESGA